MQVNMLCSLKLDNNNEYAPQLKSITVYSGKQFYLLQWRDILPKRQPQQSIASHNTRLENKASVLYNCKHGSTQNEIISYMYNTN